MTETLTPEVRALLRRVCDLGNACDDFTQGLRDIFDFPHLTELMIGVSLTHGQETAAERLAHDAGEAGDRLRKQLIELGHEARAILKAD